MLRALLPQFEPQLVEWTPSQIVVEPFRPYPRRTFRLRAVLQTKAGELKVTRVLPSLALFGQFYVN